MAYVYHGSPIGGLKHIEPSISTHGKNWVYATKDKSVALIFLQKWNDYLINQSINNGQHELTERLPNVFKEIYKGKSGFLYYLDSKNFIDGQTSFTPEVISNKIEQVIKCEEIKDCYVKLCEMEKNKEIILYRYPDKPDYIPLDNSDLIKKTQHFSKNSQNKKELTYYVIKRHPNLEKSLLSLFEY